MTTKMTGTRTINPTNVLLFLPLWGQMQLLLAFLLLLLLLLLRYRSYLVCDERVRYITVMTITLAVLLHLRSHGVIFCFLRVCLALAFLKILWKLSVLGLRRLESQSREFATPCLYDPPKYLVRHCRYENIRNLMSTRKGESGRHDRSRTSSSYWWLLSSMCKY